MTTLTACTYHHLTSYYCVGTGKDRTGFEKLPDSDPTAAVIAAARKSRQHKNLIALKIGAVILTVSAVAAVLVALIFSRGSTETETGSPILGSRRARTMKIDITDHEAVDSVAAATEMFSRDLYRVMMSVSAEDDNLLLSPYSAAMVLTMATAGAHGNTEQQMKTGLHISVSFAILTITSNAQQWKILQSTCTIL